MTSNPLASLRPNIPSALPSQALGGHTRGPFDNPDPRTASNSAARTATQDDEAHPAKRRKVQDTGGLRSSPGPDGRHDAAENSAGYTWSRAEKSLVLDAFVADPGHPVNPSRPADNPPRPWRHKTGTKLLIRDSRGPLRVRKEIPVPNIPDVLETPGCGRKMTKCCITSFVPWTGKHPEDVLSELNVKHGYCDRAPNPPEKEMNTAKLPLYNAFKTKFGLDTLSNLYSLAVEGRTQRESLPSSSNFKPPPRVTLTEAKRKSWLLDLANAEVPLRRLSRTIPQGIRGQLLLDQCLQHGVPIPRAVWFTKCVGANEIRSLKRKGSSTSFAVGAEAKWLKEWTTSIEQFVETTTQKQGEPEWRSDIRYAIRLITRLYYENLLDRDHFLDWLLKSLAATPLPQLPFWLMLAHIFTSDLSRTRNKSRRLAIASMEKLQVIQKADDQTLMPLATKLRRLIHDLALSRPQSFLMPSRWPLCEEVLQSCLDLHNQDDQEVLRQLTTANQRLLHDMQNSSSTVKSQRPGLIHVLDSAQSPYDIRHIYEVCTNTVEDSTMRLMTMLEWCTTRFRSSQTRVYLVARLLRLCHRDALDTDAAFRTFMSRARTSPTTDPRSLKHLVLELSRSRTISMSKYLQWMTVSGAHPASFHLDLHAAQRQVVQGRELDVVYSQYCDDDLQALTDFSLVHVEDHVVNWRNNMLARHNFDPEAETALINHCKCYLASSLSSCSEPPDEFRPDCEYTQPDWSTLSWSVRCHVAHWIRYQARLCCTSNPPSASNKNVCATVKLDIADFVFIRRVLEQMNDLAVLADVLRIASMLLQEDMLAHITDTIHRHADTFSTIGALDDLQNHVCQAYVSLKSARSTLPLLATSLLGLNQNYPTRILSVNRLVRDIIEGSRDRPMAACSPFSDTIAESLQQAENFVEEFEAILQAETNMAEQTMTQLFTVLIERIQKRMRSPDDDQLQLFYLLARLRSSKVMQGNQLVSEWLGHQITRESVEILYNLIVHLVYTGCVDLVSVMEKLDKLQEGNALQTLRMRVLEPQAIEKSTCAEPAQYRFALELSRYLQAHPIDHLTLLASLIREGSMKLALDEDLLSICAHPAGRHVISLDTLPSEILIRLPDVLDRTLHCGSTNSSPRNLDLAALVTRVNDLSLPMCSLRASLYSRTQDTLAPDERVDIAQSLFSIATASPPDLNILGKPPWASLLSSFPSSVSASVMHKSTESLFASLPPILQTKPSSHVPSLAETAKYLRIATHAQPVSNLSEPPGVISHPLIEKFSLFLKALNSNNTPMETLKDYLPLLLHMTLLLKSPTTTSLDIAEQPQGKPAQNESLKILLLLTSIALHPTLADTNLPSFIFDTASLITDTLSEEYRLGCARFLAEKMMMDDARVQWLFSSTNSTTTMDATMGEGLGLQVVKDGVGKVGEWRVRPWEVLEGTGVGVGGMGGWIGLGVFGARRG